MSSFFQKSANYSLKVFLLQHWSSIFRVALISSAIFKLEYNLIAALLSFVKIRLNKIWINVLWGVFLFLKSSNLSRYTNFCESSSSYRIPLISPVGGLSHFLFTSSYVSSFLVWFLLRSTFLSPMISWVGVSLFILVRCSILVMMVVVVWLFLSIDLVELPWRLFFEDFFHGPF